ncbi:hypothetical protein [Bacillus testis]|uniref:hypothetical protein n=1 Tax=Bacillus testis TaxID=1622072 RepID=UPI00067EB6C3|nr:hypothetical protein [Bacillus testis]
MEVDLKKVLTPNKGSDFIHLHTAFNDDWALNAYLERDVYSYISNLYAVMTKNGFNYHSKKDSRFITEAAKEQFRLSEHEVQ